MKQKKPKTFEEAKARTIQRWEVMVQRLTTAISCHGEYPCGLCQIYSSGCSKCEAEKSCKILYSDFSRALTQASSLAAEILHLAQILEKGVKQK